MKKQCPKCAAEGRDTTGNGLHVYKDGTGYCFKCKTNFPKGVEVKPVSTLTVSQVETYPYGNGKDRKIPDLICSQYGVRHSVDTSTGDPDAVYYPFYVGKKIVGYKVRRLPKDFRPSVGKIGESLFGRNLASSDKFLFLTEGEEDCLAAATMLNGKRIDVMSVPNGASMCKAISDEADLFAQYERVYLHFDSDKAGEAAMSEIADFLAPITEVRTVITELDASDLHVSGQKGVFLKAIKEAQQYEPEGIVNGVDIMLEDLLVPLPEGYTVPFPGLQEKLHGVRKGEILTVCAGSGVGKSTLVREMVLGLIEQGLSVANIALEDRMEDAAKHLIAMDMQIPFHSFKFKAHKKEDVQPHYDKCVGNGNTFFYKHFAGITADSLMNKLYYYARSKAVDFIVLDHLSMVISATDTQNERKAIDTLMTNLAKMVVETGVGLIQIVHLRRTSGDKSFAKGGEVELTDLRGSAALEQLSWTVIGLERDQQGDDRDFSICRVLKNRVYGFTGIADYLKYEATTGRMHSVELPSLDDEGELDDAIMDT